MVLPVYCPLLPSYDLHKLSDTQSTMMYYCMCTESKKITGLSFSKLSFKVVTVYVLVQSSDTFTKNSDMLNKNTIGVKKV